MTSSYDLNFSIDLNHIDQDHLHRHQPSAALIIPEDHNSPDQRQFNYLSLSHINDNNKPPVVDAASSSSSSTCSNSSSYSSSISLFHPTPQPQPPPPPYNCPVYFNPSSQDHHQAAAAAAPAPAGICYEYDSPKLVVDLDQINKMELHQYQNQTTATAAAPGVEINNMISRRREIINSPVVKWKVRRLIMKKKTTKTDHNKKRQKQTPLGDDDEHAPESDINVHVCTVNATVRVCADCNTTKTPLWRSGPRGPKSLCNACGIRQRKARRAAILAANNTGSVTGSGLSQVTTSTTTTMRSYSSTNNNINHHNNKTPKVANDKPLSSPAPPTHAQGQGQGQAQAQAQAHHYCHDRINQRKQICFEEFAHSLTKNLSIQQILFPQEEKDAAILLMALSCDALISIPN